MRLVWDYFRNRKSVKVLLSQTHSSTEFLTWSVPQPQLDSLQFQIKACCVVFKHCGHIALRRRQYSEYSRVNTVQWIQYSKCSLQSLVWCVSGINTTWLTSGKLSLANTFNRAVFPHRLSPTTTILHSTLESESILTAVNPPLVGL